MLLASPQYCAGTRGLEVAGGKVWSPSSGTTEMPRLVERRRPASGGYGEEGVRDAELGGWWLLSPSAICCPHLCHRRCGQASGQEVPARLESGVGRGREQAKLDLQYDKAKLITSRL